MKRSALVVLVPALLGLTVSAARSEVPSLPPPPASPVAPILPQAAGVLIPPIHVSSVVGVSEASTNTYYMDVTVRNDTAKDASVVLNVDPKLGYVDPKHPLTIPAKGHVVHRLAMGHDKLCEATPYSFEMRLSPGPGIDDRTRKATHPTPSFAIGEIKLGVPGAPPSAAEAQKQLRITSASVVGGYACNQPFKMKAHVANGTPNKVEHVIVEMLDQPAAGAPPFVTDEPASPQGFTMLPIASGAAAEFTVTSKQPLGGRSGVITLKLTAPPKELGGVKLGYYRYAHVTVLDNAVGHWKLE